MNDTNANPDAKAWGDFWANNSGGDGGGCLPERWAAIEDAQKAIWSRFVFDLPAGAEILDLATGDGRVLRWMHEQTADLVYSGVDLAPELPLAPEGTTTEGGIAMEELPFADHQFDGVVSQFGFEYGDVEKTASEIARVLKPGGCVGLMVHRGDGPILEHNLARKDAIAWVLGEIGVAKAVDKALNAPGAGPDVAAQVAAAVAKLGASKFGETSPAWEIPEAIRRACLMGQSESEASVTRTMAAIEEQAANEVGRIDSLMRACATADDRDRIAAIFDKLGFVHEGVEPVTEPSGRELADFLTFSAAS